MLVARGVWLRWLSLGVLISLLAVVACRSDSSTAGSTAPTASSGASSGTSASPSAGGSSANSTPTTTKEVGVTATEILLGSHAPLSGPASSYSVIHRAAEAYFKQVNEEGGVNGRKIQFMIQDDGYQPNRTVEVVKKLVEQDQIFALFHGLGTPTHSAVVDYLIEKGVPDMLVASGATKWNYPLGPSTKKTVFGFNADYHTDAAVMTKYVLENFKAKKMGFIYQNDDLGRDYLQGFEDAFRKNDASSFVAKEAYEVGATDLSAQVLKMREAGVEVLFLAATPAPVSKVINAKAALSYSVQIIASGAFDPALFKLSRPEDVEGLISTMYLPQWDDSGSPGVQAHRDLLKKYGNGLEPSNFTVFGAAAAEIMVDMLKRAGKNLTRRSLLDAAESTKGLKISFGNEITIGPEDHRTFKALRVIKAANGRFEFLTGFLTGD